MMDSNAVVASLPVRVSRKVDRSQKKSLESMGFSQRKIRRLIHAEHLAARGTASRRGEVQDFTVFA